MKLICLAALGALMGWAAGCGGEIERIDGVASPMAESPAPVPRAATGLAPNTCVSLVENESAIAIAFVDLGTGRIENGPNVGLTGYEASQVSSIGLLGNDIYFCHGFAGSDPKVARVSLADGSMTTVPASCVAVTADAGGIWVLDLLEESARQYPDFAALREKKSSSTRDGLQQASRIGASPNGLISAWHSTHTIERAAGSVELEGYDGWLWGISGATGGRLVISSPASLGGEGALVAFDASKGTRLGVVAKVPNAHAAVGFHGLACAY